MVFHPVKDKQNHEARRPAQERSRNLRSKSLFTNNSPETTAMITDINNFNKSAPKNNQMRDKFVHDNFDELVNDYNTITERGTDRSRNGY